MKLKPGLPICTFVALFAYVPNAFAYLDPGTGSILLQGLIAGIAGGLMFLRLYWQKLKAIFVGRSREDSESRQGPEDEE